MPKSQREVRFTVALIGNFESLGRGHRQADFFMEKNIIEAIYEAKEKGYRIKVLKIPLRIQREIALNIAISALASISPLISKDTTDLIRDNGLIEFYGYPVEVGDTFQVVYEDPTTLSDDRADSPT